MEKDKKIAAKSSGDTFDYLTIKSFDDACARLNIDPLELPTVPRAMDRLSGRIIADYKLCIIFEAINNGWTPDWSKPSQYKYYPWYPVLSSGFGFDGSGYGCDRTNTTVGSRLCTDTAKKALYIAVTFIKEYEQYLLILK
jgi:hypothetical protein